MKEIKVAAIQPKPVDDELINPKNVDHAIKLIRKCVKMDEDVDIICFPEYYPWFGEERLAREAGELGVYLIAGIAEESGGKRYNSCVLFSPDGQVVGRQRKVNLGLMERERFGFSPGSEYQVFETKLCRIGIGICVDFWGPPHVGHKLLELGAELIFNPSFFFIFREKWRCFVFTRMVELMTPIVAVNTAEFQFRLGDRVFPRCGGLSFVMQPPWRTMDEFAQWWYDPTFNWITSELGLEEGILVDVVDVERAKRFRKEWYYRLLGSNRTVQGGEA